MTDTTAQFKRQLPWNSLFQLLSFLTQVGIGMWLVPYLVRHLGTAAFGLIPIAGMLTQYAGLISQSISSAVSRFLTIALQREDAAEANRIFSTAFFSYLGIGVLQIPLFALIIYFADRLIDIPAELYRDALVLLACSALAFVVNLVSSVFGVPTYACNRLDISRCVDIGRNLARLAGIVALFVAWGPALRYVGYVDLGIAIVLCPVQMSIAWRLAPALSLRLRHYDWRKIRQLTGMGGWLLVNNVGALLFLRMDAWICNRVVGPEAAGEYAAVQQWPTLIRQGGAVIAAVAAPMVVIYFAKAEMEQLVRLSKVSVRVLSLLLAVPIAIMCVYSSTLLSLWLGDGFTPLAPLMILMLCHLVVNVGVLPLLNIQVAMNKVRIPALVTLGMGVVNLLLAIVFASYFGWGVYGVAAAGALVLTAQNALFTPLYSARILGQPWHVFVGPCVSALVLLAVLAALGWALHWSVVPSTWGQLFLAALGMGAVGTVVAWFLLPARERRFVLTIFPQRLRFGLQGKSI